MREERLRGVEGRETEIGGRKREGDKERERSRKRER